MCPAGNSALCRPGDALCAPCGAGLVGHSVALTFSYDFFDAVVLRTDFEVCLSCHLMHTTVVVNMGLGVIQHLS